jgi:hypothetical protein
VTKISGRPKRVSAHTTGTERRQHFVRAEPHTGGQRHWGILRDWVPTELAIADLRKLFPTVPAGGTAGARDEYSTYLHLLVCYLEQQADLRVLGELKTKPVMDFWATELTRR